VQARGGKPPCCQGGADEVSWACGGARAATTGKGTGVRAFCSLISFHVRSWAKATTRAKSEIYIRCYAPSHGDDCFGCSSVQNGLLLCPRPCPGCLGVAPHKTARCCAPDHGHGCPDLTVITKLTPFHFPPSFFHAIFLGQNPISNHQQTKQKL
jgi:hypothetical protein